MGIGTRRASAGATTVAAVALVTVASLGVIAWQRMAGEPAVATTATLGGLTAEVDQAGWVDFDHGHVMDLDGGSGFMMPDQMMPGAPSLAGDEVRLGVTLTLANTDPGPQEFNLAREFSMTGGADTQPQPLVADSFGTLPRLTPGAAVSGTLYFDVAPPEADDPPFYLVWDRAGRTSRLVVPLTGGDGDVPDHEH